jgi:HEAT repeats
MTRTTLRAVSLFPLALLILLTAGLQVMQAAESSRAPGEQHRWALTFRVRLEQAGAEKPITVDLSGDWASTVSAVHFGTFDAVLQLSNLKIKGDGSKSLPNNASEMLERRLERQFWATYREDGALVAVHFFKDMPPSDRNLLEMIATETQLVHAGPDQSTWTTLERDGGGEYLAIYNQPAANTVVKRKLKYVYTDGTAEAPSTGLQVSVRQSELRFSTDGNGAILSLNGLNRVEMGVPFKDAGHLTAVTEIHLANPRKSRAPELIGSMVRALPGITSSPVVTQKPDSAQVAAELHERLLEGYSTESLLEATTKDSNDAMLSERLVALFFRRPEAAAAALKFLRAHGAQKRITYALASAATPAAVSALDAIAHDRSLPSVLRVDALNAFVLMRSPSTVAMHVPGALLDEADGTVSAAAQLASGALARAGRPVHPAEAEKIDQQLVSRYRKAQTATERAQLLSALGNSVGPSVLPAIKDVLRDPHDPVRSTAARALRLASGADIDAVLAAAISSDPDPTVREAAISATSFRHPIGKVIGEALVQAANADPFDYVRSAAISLLRQNPDCSPRIPETLASIAEHDAKAGIRRQAQNALTFLAGQQAR